MFPFVNSLYGYLLMKFSLWRDFGALNSKPVFEAFEHSLIKAGHTVNENDMNSDVAVIWSVLWNGRMAGNKTVWNHYRNTGRNVIVLEVGGIKRGTTWKVAVNGVNRDAYFGIEGNNSARAEQLGLRIEPWRTNGEYILICGQHNRSLQWIGQPPMSQWLMDTIETIQCYTDKPIVFRPHPRCKLENIETQYKNVYRQEPKKLPDTYDDFDMQFERVYATVSWSSNPGVRSVLKGVPAFVGPSSLAYDVSNINLANIEDPAMPDRTQWLNDYAWTEYTVDEIANGVPLSRLTDMLS